MPLIKFYKGSLVTVEPSQTKVIHISEDILLSYEMYLDVRVLDVTYRSQHLIEWPRNHMHIV